MRKFLAGASRLFFRGLHAAEGLVSLPRSISEPLHFREDWDAFLKTPSNEPTIWVHGASVGELEDLANFFLDAQTLAEAGYSLRQLVVTSSSPSAKPFLAKLAERLPLAYAGPVPSEDPTKIEAFLAALKPELLVLSHSDLWPNLMDLAQEKALSKGLVWMPSKASSSQGLFEKIIAPATLKAVGARSPEDLDALKLRLGPIYPDVEIVWVGNPRLDRIATRIKDQQGLDHHVLEDARAQPDPSRLSMLIGSVWPEDAAAIAEALKGLPAEARDRLQIVAIPHVTDDMHLTASIQHLLPQARVLPIQGVLLEAYQGFDLAFVGGGYRTGLHSILEPAMWGLPIFCGPQLRKQPEAASLQKAGVLFPILETSELGEKLALLLADRDALAALKRQAIATGTQMKASTGASKRLSRLVGKSKISQ
jgi:3-deoxy-D-manno-octulosonic-acid transferase